MKKKQSKRKGNKYSRTIRATLDLHGNTKAEAYDLLIKFLRDSREQKFKLVQIVTGSGVHSPNGKAVLKPFVEKTLKEEGYEFSPAKMNEGGAGAFDVIFDF